MRYVVRKSIVEVVGEIWMPYGTVCATTYTLSGYDVENCRNDNGQITRDSVERWVGMHSGDFSSVRDFRASLEDGDETVDIPWASEEGELAFVDCTASVE